MNSNSFEIYGTNDSVKAFIESSIESAQTVIDHYTFVIDDISSVITDPKLQATKAPTLEFLLQMREKWLDFKNDLEIQLKVIQK